MLKKEWEALGFVKIGLDRLEYQHGNFSFRGNLRKINTSDLVKQLFNSQYQKGKTDGYEEKSQQIKDVLGIKNNSCCCHGGTYM